MTTVRDLVKGSLRDLGVYAPGESLPADEATDGFDQLNRLVDLWRTENLTIPDIVRSTFTINANDGDYSIGSGGDIAIVRPVFIDRVSYTDTSASTPTETALNRLTEVQYQNIPQKTRTSTAPDDWYYTPTYPTGTLYLFPVPTSSTLQGVIYAWTALPAFASLDTDLSLPAGYEEFLQTQLALRLAPTYHKTPDPMLMRAAQMAKQNIQYANVRMVELMIEPRAMVGNSLRNWYDIYSG